jgi:nucleoside-diphosphate-sugar epimerase
MTMARVAITGAGGFLGRHLCEELAGRHFEVRGIVRRPTALPAGVDVRVVREIGDEKEIREALEGCDGLVHLAARVHMIEETASDPLAAFRLVNVEGTRSVLEGAAAAGVRRFVFVSSVKAIGEGDERIWDEDTPPSPSDPYGVSKLEAEELIRALAPARGLETTILRIPLVYGPGMRANMLRLFQLVDRGIPLPFGAITNRRSLVYVGNVVAAIAIALESPAAGGETFFVSDGEDVSTGELVRKIAAALGRSPRLIGVPPKLFELAGRWGDAVPRPVPWPVRSPQIRRLLGSLAIDPGKLARTTGFVAPYRLDEGLARTAAWYRVHNAADPTR